MQISAEDVAIATLLLVSLKCGRNNSPIEISDFGMTLVRGYKRINVIFFQTMLPVVVGVNGITILLTPLLDG